MCGCRDVTFPPGVLDTGMHTHAYAHVGIILSEGALQFTDPGGKTDRVEFKAGSVGFREANATHQVGNPGRRADARHRGGTEALTARCSTRRAPCCEAW